MNERETYTYYYIPNIWKKDELDVEDSYLFKSRIDIAAVSGGYDEFETRWLVEEMASDFYSGRDGWEIADSWAGNCRDFALWDTNKNFVGTFEVMLEYEPTFNAWRKE